jgi:DNA-binding phage protein
MLACAECVADTNGLGWAFCDTDSLALARPEGMYDKAFLQRCVRVTGWFDRLDPYCDGKPLFKVEDQNFRLEGGPAQEPAPLYALAISAKRYVLFNRDADGRPVIRKALAHGLGHLMEPYGEKDAPKSIPLPPQGLAGLEVKRWQHDHWYQIVLAFLEGHPDRIVFPKTPKLDQPARSRYGATTPSLLNWFCHFNEGKPLSEQVKPFNFMLAYSTSKIRFAKAIANGDLDDEFIGNGLPAVAAPYHDDTENAVVGAFDRRTGKPVPFLVLKTYREAIAEYAWHSESKFENGDTHDTGITRRRHIEAIAVEYIGKEANRWEEQFYLGEIPDAAVSYGFSDNGRKHIIHTLRLAAQKFGKAVLAEEAGITRQELAAILSNEPMPRASTMKALTQALFQLQAS